ncbi:acyloxyacyl hydrolase [Salibacter halophilus]|uniref:Acyloxyacyl hydrolase n=1 Tax=Salibacter halophilus TaxID=1803916 RepID=A0A6N6M8G3_9FLAO|nr:acyloxyacyl hydrolase [Salibacter halophilus]KAB1065145.1 acyloxyacyl hydrolase [Salibacter halophilus]
MLIRNKIDIKLLLTVTASFILSFFSFGQNLERTHYFQQSFNGGSLIDIYPGSPESNVVNAINLSWLSKTNDSTSYRSKFGNSLHGFTFGFFDLGNKEVLGHAFTGQYTMLFPQKINHVLTWEPGLSMGGAVFTNPYNYLENEENIVMGSRVAFWVSAYLRLHYSFSDELNAFVGAAFHHSSNGHTALPNVGANIPSWQLGVRYRFSKKTAVEGSDRKLDNLFDKWQYGFRLGHGFYELGETISPTNGPLYAVYTTQLYAQRKVSDIGRLRIGLEGHYNRGHRALYEIVDDPDTPEANFENSTLGMAFSGYEVAYGHWAVYLQAGYNFHNPGLAYWLDFLTENEFMDRLKKRVSGRYGVHYYFKNPYDAPNWNLYAGLEVKSMVVQADFLELCVGVNFGKKD